MDDLEPELRAAFGRLADGAEPSDALVGRTLARSTSIRRRRNAITASGVGAAVLILMFAVAAVAGPNDNGSNFQVAGTGPGSVPVTSTTVTPATPPTTAPAGRTTTVPHAVSPTVPVTTTTAASCTPATVPGGVILEMQPNGAIAAIVSLASGPGAILTPYTLDDGSTGAGGFRKVYTPAEFGPHWYEITSPGVDGNPCPARHAFDVSPSSLTTTTTSGTTETSVPSDSTTIPETTTSVAK
jgi:hypothetical protein